MQITHDRTYRLSFFGALLLHIIVAIFLSIEMASLKKQEVTANSVNIIKAFAVSASEVASSMQKAAPLQTVPPPPEPHTAVQEKASKASKVPVPEVKPISHPKLPTTTISKNALKQKMQKSLLQEEAKEAQVTQKKVQEQKQALEKLKHLKQQQELQKLLHGELASESKQLKQQNQKTPVASTEGKQAENVKDSSDGALSKQDQSEIDKYKALIIQALSSEWIIPQGVEKNDMCKLVITLGPGGVVLDIKVTQPSKNPLLLRATQAAIWKASPLPIPKESSLFPNFRTIQLTARPEGMTEE